MRRSRGHGAPSFTGRPPRGEREPTLFAEHLDRAEAPEAARAYLAAARAQSGAMHPERALALAERGVRLAKDPADVVGLELLRGRLHFDVGEGKPSITAYESALAQATEPADRCRAWLGIAAGHRLLASLDAAFAALDQAEPLARANALTRELAELHYTRGNLHFARSEAAACREQHAAALECARTVGDPAWEARAMSGLADADYIEGRMRTAISRFVACVELCERHGLRRIAIPNRIMIGHCRNYLMDFDAGIADMRASGEAAVSLGDRHGEMFALESEGLSLVLCGRYPEAVPILERGIALAEAIGARRYEATMLCALAETEAAAGKVADAHEHIERALALSRATDMRFCGPMILGVKASILPSGAEREACRTEADRLLAQTCVGHNAISYHRYGIDDTLKRGEWARARAHADALEAYTREEPLPYADFLIARARALARLGEAPRDAPARANATRLAAEARRLDLRVRWPSVGSA
jgi:tetratricopeptide (TPR) repeat protein